MGQVKLELDKASQKRIMNQLEIARDQGKKSAYYAMMKVAFKIKSEAKLRLVGRGHIITSRLANSIFVQAKNLLNVTKSDNSLTYTDHTGKSYKSKLSTVTLGENEFAVGTNVSYGPAIEIGAKPHIIEAKNSRVLGNTKVGFFGKRVNHPGFAGDSYLYWAFKNVDIIKSVADDMRNDIKFGKFLKRGNVKGQTK